MLNYLKACPKTAILIGDSHFDLDAAACVHMPSYIVTTGSQSKIDIAKHNNQPIAVFDNLCKLGETLFGFSPAKIETVLK